VLAVVSCDGEHHDAATTTWNFCCRNDRYCGLRLHLHAETKKGPLNTGPRDEARRIAANIVKLLGC
jgi:hypothetical protein